MGCKQSVCTISMVNTLRRAHEDDAFVLSNGIKITTLEELLREVTLMSFVEFDSYARRNDFSRWVATALYHQELADRIYDITDKRLVEDIIREYLIQPPRESYHSRTQTPQQSQQVQSQQAQQAQQRTQAPQQAQSEQSRSEAQQSQPSAPQQAQPVPQPAPQQSQQQSQQVQSEQPAQFEVSQAEQHPNQQRVSDEEVLQQMTGEDQQYMPEKPAEDSLSQHEIQKTRELLELAQQEINRIFIGQEEVVEKTLLTLMCGAHALLEGVPGLAKTLLIETLAKVVSGTTFKRIQFMPDTLPSDVIGGQMFNPASGDFKTIKGPVFTNFLLADEINRAPPKTHSALMEAMQEKKVSIDKTDYPLDKPFFVLATQNPLENKGTYELPEAVMDRFMFKIMLGYPKREHERIILTENSTTKKDIFSQVKTVMTKEDILAIQERTTKVFISEEIREYILDIVEATRGKNKKVEGVRFLQYGAGVRASIYLTIASKARALSQGRAYVLPEDIRSVVPDILRHRLALNYIGKAHNISTDKIIDEVLKKTSAL